MRGSSASLQASCSNAIFLISFRSFRSSIFAKSPCHESLPVFLSTGILSGLPLSGGDRDGTAAGAGGGTVGVDGGMDFGKLSERLRPAGGIPGQDVQLFL